jgi:hypothetical protein
MVSMRREKSHKFNCWNRERPANVRRQKILDRAVVEKFLDCKLKELEIEIPKDISKEALVEAFYQYVGNDYYEWLKDNF